MMMLYGKDTKGGIKQWSVETNGADIIVTHGKLGGKMQRKVTTCKGKNLGKKNETTPEEQAIREASSKYQKQIDKLYRPTIEELEDSTGKLPMLAHDFLKVGHRVHYPCSVSPKLDGVRTLAIVRDESVSMGSRGGKQYDVPDHILQDLLELRRRVKENTPASVEEEIELDGEIYIHGVPLNRINSLIKNPDLDKRDLRFYIFDVPNSNRPWLGRYADLMDLCGLAAGLDSLCFVPSYTVNSEDEARQMLDYFVSQGYEGLMFRMLDTVYEYNHRSSGLIKWKLFQDIEALVVGVTEDKNGEGVLLCVLKDGTKFECKIKGSHDERSYHSLINSVGRHLVVKYQQLTEYGVPQFPVGLAWRRLDENWEPLE